jgi:lipopolysaccharide export system protein LptC
MRFSTTRLFPLGLMLALALLTFYLERTVREEQPAPAVRRHDPDYIVNHFTTTTYDRGGRVESVMSAERMVHYPDDDTTEMFAPRVLQSRRHEPTYTVRAERGQLSPDGDEIFLWGDVQLVRGASAAGPETRMSTEFLHILRERSLVRTDRPVKIVEGTRSLSGRGMEYDNLSRELVLRNDVVAVFGPLASEP